ncbi:c-type cytochrome [Oceanicola sp. S124]|uniref:c-type cytochrome n=1 Tax=Oceanicola sp. S124 TaxID=1042378 RepID=UPI00030D44F0|nr:cytochrome c [Oceanicola sp. S124]
MKPRTAAIVAVIALGTAALTPMTPLAHAEASNPAVKERIALMGEIRGNFAVIGGMAQGRVDFDAAKAEEAQAALAAAAAMIPEKFEPQETDPESEASPAIWEDWDQFTAIAAQLEQAALALDVSSLDGIKAGFGSVGGNCGACHKAFRVE